ncbi:integrase, catalytic region, zinc finger, CCHC-type containing protein, partial [Tanacetum coccineum]
MTEFPQLDSGLSIHMFTQRDDPIACLNMAMAFLTVATIQDGRDTMQQVQGRQGQSYTGTGYKGEGRMARQCTQPKRPRNTAWFKDNAMLAEAQESGQFFDEEQLAFLDLGIPNGQVAQTTILNNDAFQTKDLNAYDSDCDDVLNAQAVLMANLSNYGSDVISELSYKLKTLKEHIKSMQENDKEEKVKQDMDEIETINIELEHIKEIKRENVLDNATTITNATTIAPGMFKLDLDPLAPRLLKNRDAHIDCLKYTQEQAYILRRIVEQAKAKQPLDNALDFACKHAKRIQELLVYVPSRLKSSTSASRSQPTGNKKNDRISQTPSSNMKNKVEVQLRRANLSSNKKNRVKDPICDTNVKRKLFTLVGNSCPLTRFTLANLVPPKETTSHSVETQKSELKVYNRKPKQIKSVDVPSSSSLINDRLSRLFSGIRSIKVGSTITCFLVGQFCDADLEVAFQKNTCFIWNLEGVDLLSGSRDTNLYIISLDDMLNTSPICLLSKASKTKSWLWHCQLSHLNFGTLNKLAKDGLALGIPNLKFQKDHLYNRTAFVNQTLCDFYENVGILHQTFVARTPQQNGVVERRNQTLMEVARTMLIFSKAPLFLWAKAINTACYTQNRSLICLRDNKTPYELMHDKKQDLSFLHVFGSLCYLTNDSDDLGKLNAKADIGIFVGYAPAKKVFRIYNRRTRKIMKTIHVTFDELTAMASKQFGSGPELQCMTATTSSSRLVPNPIPQQPFPVIAKPRVVDIPESLVATLIDLDAPSTNIPSTEEQEHSLIISQGFEESPKTSHFHDYPLHESLHEDSTSHGSSSNVRPTHTLFEHLGRWTKGHPIANVISDPSRSISTRKQLETDTMWCYFDAFLTSVEPKNFKQAMTKSSWIYEMQD